MCRGRPLDATEIATARTLREQGLTWRQIAWRLNRDHSGLARAVEREIHDNVPMKR